MVSEVHTPKDQSVEFCKGSFVKNKIKIQYIKMLTHQIVK
jgi:hypothetical protein